jgi:Uma2 family endonuclease
MAQTKTSSDRLTVDAYIAGENDGVIRHEYVDGRIFAMAGASERHNLIKLNLAVWLHARLPAGCRLFDGDMKLRLDTPQDTRFYYPDIFIACGQHNLDQYDRTDAQLIIEVLSPSTARVDRYEKMQAYTALPTLAEYLIVEQDVPRAELFRRRTAWAVEMYGWGDIIQLDSVAGPVDLTTIYRSVFS